MTDGRVTRAQRRERSRAAILDAARQTFAEKGFEKATIRAVAERAGCVPALVMQHFGSKEALFREATALDLDIAAALHGPEAGRSRRVLEHTFGRMDANADSIASTLRAMLTHDQVAYEAMRLFNPPDPHEDRLPSASGELGAELVLALTLGTAILRYVLTAPAVAGADLARLVDHLVPAVAELETGGDPTGR